MKNIHNAVSDLMDIIDRRNQMTARIEDRGNHYIQVHIRQGTRYICIEVFEEGTDEYTDVVLLREENFTTREVNYIMDTFVSCLDSREPNEVRANSESSTRAGRRTH